MDFLPVSGGIQTFPSNIPLPFYMTYPGYFRKDQDSEAVRDLEYLQAAYPKEVRQMQKKVAQVLDKVDYEGSMIYDEYPDKYSIMRLAETISHIMRQEMETQEMEVAGSPEKWEWQRELIQVLLSDEIYKRRHGGKRGFIK